LKGEDITIYGDGSQTRTFCFIDDNITATTNAFYQNKFVNDVVNIGGDTEMPILEVAKLIIKLTKSSSKIVHLPALKDGDMTRRRPDTAKMRQLLEKEPLTLEQGLQKLLQNTSYII
ncbi:MAG: NAD-dependent epimerase/dehydratase family protein, partial [Bacteroidia bacterium]|nr:NAD-dependent epimerase/dehydratase family protein [Bacteroidia bacterium]